ncbi:MAG: AAA family ATPase, partial [Defluviitaleaceae bacterium]|nr:AAA family ATPase [Defluviitaleaceae bacterium]
TANITGVNELLAAALDIKEKGSRRITTEVITKLKGTKRVIIIDEAQHLKAKVVNHLRSIVDATENEETGERIGMALVGNHEIYFELKIRQQAAYRQVADRITYWELLRAEDVVMDDIRLIFTDIDLDNSCLEILYLISKMVSVRKAIQVYTNAVSLFQDSQNQNSQESDGESGEGETMQNPQNEMGAGYLAAVALKMGVDINRK